MSHSFFQNPDMEMLQDPSEISFESFGIHDDPIHDSLSFDMVDFSYSSNAPTKNKSMLKPSSEAKQEQNKMDQKPHLEHLLCKKI